MSPAGNFCPPPLTPDRLAGLLDTRADPAGRLVLALTALHATNGTDLRNLTLADLLLARGQLLLRRPHGRRHTTHLDETTTALLHAWLRYRHKRWPRTANPTCSSPNRPPAPQTQSAPSTSAAVSPPAG
ncbi:hypothetical protein [Streptomyces sp. NPDC005336]|uniref:hypothetical protein n=1 Tax=Streptomyces sp. NPDC005336 TaxID=3157035 RepID=UPI0033A67E0A